MVKNWEHGAWSMKKQINQLANYRLADRYNRHGNL